MELYLYVYMCSRASFPIIDWRSRGYSFSVNDRDYSTVSTYNGVWEWTVKNSCHFYTSKDSSRWDWPCLYMSNIWEIHSRGYDTCKCYIVHVYLFIILANVNGTCTCIRTMCHIDEKHQKSVTCLFKLFVFVCQFSLYITWFILLLFSPLFLFSFLLSL